MRENLRGPMMEQVYLYYNMSGRYNTVKNKGITL